MNAEPPVLPAAGSAAALRGVLGGPDWPQASILTALLDAAALYGEPGLPAASLQPLFAAWWPDRPMMDNLAALVEAGLVSRGPDGLYAVPDALAGAVTDGLAQMLTRYTIDLPQRTVEFGLLLDDFAGYLAGEAHGAVDAAATGAWAGRAFLAGGRRTYLLLRPMPLCLRTQDEAHTLLLVALPADGSAAINREFVERPALRHRLALYDLEQGYKLNLTRGALAVYFERYLQRVHRLRLAPPPAFTDSLVDAGLLRFEKG